MNKNEFMRKLKECLVGMNQTDKREILLDYEEHFLDGIKEGRSEEEISASLGEPSEIAANLKKASAESHRSNTEGMNTAGYIIGIIALSIGCFWLASFIISVLGTVFSGVFMMAVAAAAPIGAIYKLAAICGLAFVLSISGLIILGLIKLVVLIVRWFTKMINGLTTQEDKKIKKEIKMIKFPAWLWVLLAVIAVVSLGGAIYGGVSIGVDFVEKYESGEFDEFISEVEDWDENIDDFDVFIDNIEGLDALAEWDDNHPGLMNTDRWTRGFGFLGFFRMNSASSVNDSQRLDLAGISTIEIEADSAAISIVTGSEARATLSGKSVFDNEKIVVTQSGSTLKVAVQERRFTPGYRYIKLEVVLPDDVYNELIVKNSSGMTTVNGVVANQLTATSSSGMLVVDGKGKTYGVITLDNSSGMAKLENVSDAEYVSVKNSSGMLRVKDVTADEIVMESTSGLINCDDVTGLVNATASSGGISYNGKLTAGNHSFEASSGRVSLDLEPGPMSISASAGSGHVSVEQLSGMTVSLTSNDAFVGGYDEDSADIANITVKTNSGSINIDFN